jgi:hypothetical protein
MWIKVCRCIEQAGRGTPVPAHFLTAGLVQMDMRPSVICHSEFVYPVSVSESMDYGFATGTLENSGASLPG